MRGINTGFNPGRVTEETVPAALRRAAAEFGDRDALAEPAGQRLSFRELGERAGEVARALIAAGIAPGDRVAVWCPNDAAWVLAALGALTAGATLVPVSTRFTGGEALDVISRSGARALFVTDYFLGSDRLAGLRAAAAAPGADGSLARLAMTVRVGGDWARFTGRAGGGAQGRGRRPGGGGGPAGRQRHPVHLGHHRAQQGRDEQPPQLAGGRPGVGRPRRPYRGRPLPGGEPVLPQLRLQGRAYWPASSAARPSCRRRSSTPAG